MFDWIANLVEQGGYLGIAALMLLENVFPPIPSELIMPLAGFAAARGELNIVGAVLAGTLGSILGAVFWYYIGVWVGDERLQRWAVRHGRWMTLTPQEIEKSCTWFARHGGIAVLVGRLVPAVRTLISVPAGISDMPLGRFLTYSTLGTIVWTALLAAAGYFLESQYQEVSNWLNPVSTIVIVVLVLAYLYRVLTFRRRVDAS